MYDLLILTLMAASLTIILYPLMSCGGRTPKSESSHPGDHGESHTSSSESGKPAKPPKSEEKHEKLKLQSSEKREHEDHVIKHEDQKPPVAVQQPQKAPADEVKQGGDDAGYESCPDMTPTQLAKVLAEMK